MTSCSLVGRCRRGAACVLEYLLGCGDSWFLRYFGTVLPSYSASRLTRSQSWLFLGAFAKLRKTTVSFSMSVHPSVCPHGTTRLPLGGFSWNFIFGYFSKVSRKFRCHLNLTRITATLHEDRYTFLIISRSVLPRMRNVSDKNCRGNQNTHFVFSTFFLNRTVYEIMWEKYRRAGQATDDNTAHEDCMLDT